MPTYWLTSTSLSATRPSKGVVMAVRSRSSSAISRAMLPRPLSIVPAPSIVTAVPPADFPNPELSRAAREQYFPVSRPLRQRPCCAPPDPAALPIRVRQWRAPPARSQVSSSAFSRKAWSLQVRRRHFRSAHVPERSPAHIDRGQSEPRGRLRERFHRARRQD